MQSSLARETNTLEQRPAAVIPHSSRTDSVGPAHAPQVCNFVKPRIPTSIELQQRSKRAAAA